MLTDKQLRTNIAENLRRALSRHKMKQSDLCRLAGVPQTSFSTIIRGKVVPGLSIALRLSEALETSLDKIVSTPTEKKSQDSD